MRPRAPPNPPRVSPRAFRCKASIASSRRRAAIGRRPPRPRFDGRERDSSRSAWWAICCMGARFPKTPGWWTVPANAWCRADRRGRSGSPCGPARPWTGWARPWLRIRPRAWSSPPARDSGWASPSATRRRAKPGGPDRGRAAPAGRLGIRRGAIQRLGARGGLGFARRGAVAGGGSFRNGLVDAVAVSSRRLRRHRLAARQLRPDHPRRPHRTLRRPQTANAHDRRGLRAHLGQRAARRRPGCRAGKFSASGLPGGVRGRGRDPLEDAVKYRLVCLTPTLIGDGQKLAPIDYMVWKDHVNVLDQRRIFRLLAKGPRLDGYLAQLKKAEKLDFGSWG